MGLKTIPFREIEEKAENKRYPMLSFANTDMAFL